jgi:hypothetical protein
MTDLQMTLWAGAGVFIAGVFSYNKWQEYKAKKSVERAFSTDHDDVLMRADGGKEAARSAAPVAPEVRHEPRFDLDGAGLPAQPGQEALVADAAPGATKTPRVHG